ncbi:hypothetical protein [Lysinibacillus pakistanensis]|uniref:hypothetical protein n=1 Tax=Lysinibacillus pakistanensis TaxID=759811 RepID=UPI0034E3F148
MGVVKFANENSLSILSNVGHEIAEYLDNKDSKPYNGWINIYEFIIGGRFRRER